MSAQPIIPPHGGYQDPKSFQMATIVYDATVAFCDRFIDRRSRTHDQMVQTARSGRQNIAEGSQASGTSKKTELKTPDTIVCPCDLAPDCTTPGPDTFSRNRT